MYSLAKGNLQCSSMSPAVMHTQPRIQSPSFPTNTNTKAIETRNLEAVSLLALPGVLFEACFRSDQHSWNTKDLLRLVYSCSETQEPRSSYSTRWGIPVLHKSLQLVKTASSSSVIFQMEAARIQASSRLSSSQVLPKSLGASSTSLQSVQPGESRAHIPVCIPQRICHWDTPRCPCKQAITDTSGPLPAEGYLARLQLQRHFSIGCFGMQPDL